MINVQNVSKTFILHQQNGVRLPVLQRASLTVNAGECVVLHGHSGSGKSTLLRSLYANYLPDEVREFKVRDKACGFDVVGMRQHELFVNTTAAATIFPPSSNWRRALR
jgi:alpha-D-ribose 1-methylphosphonate 5-triphosphate synthase subunit PhnL